MQKNIIHGIPTIVTTNYNKKYSLTFNKTAELINTCL